MPYEAIKSAMKKKTWLGILLITMMVFVWDACNKNHHEDVTDVKKDDKVESGNIEMHSSVDVLNRVFDKYSEAEKFSMVGGDFGNAVEDKAGIYDLSDTDGLTVSLHLTKDLISQIEEAASAVHMMNQNIFTSAAFRLKDAQTEQFAENLRDSIQSTRWIDGFPDKLAIYIIDEEYVVYAIGVTELMDVFTNKLETVYGERAALVVDENIL